MTKRVMGWVVAVLLVGLLSACGTVNTVVLMPDRDGHVGKVEVQTAAGAQVLDRAGTLTQVRGPQRAPSAARLAAADDLAATFGEALAVEPDAPAKFILYFETGAVALTPESEGVLSQIVEACAQRHALRIAISGHTDAVGSDPVNNALSLERAEHVKDLLVQRGLGTTPIAVVSHGKGNPAFPTPDGVAEPRNRRVEVVVH